jgi:hypothetical protein
MDKQRFPVEHPEPEAVTGPTLRMTLTNGSLRPLAPAGLGAGFFSGGALSATVPVVFPGVVGLAGGLVLLTAVTGGFVLVDVPAAFFSGFADALVVLDGSGDAPFLVVAKVPVATGSLPPAALPALAPAAVPAVVVAPAVELLEPVFEPLPEAADCVLPADPLLLDGDAVDVDEGP